MKEEIVFRPFTEAAKLSNERISFIEINEEEELTSLEILSPVDTKKYLDSYVLALESDGLITINNRLFIQS